MKAGFKSILNYEHPFERKKMFNLKSSSKLSATLLALIMGAISILGSPATAKAKTTELTMSVFVGLHEEMLQKMASKWNKMHPDNQIELEVEVIQYLDMHTKLLLQLQSGTGAPCLSDIETSQFPNFLKGKKENIQLVSLNDIINPVEDNFIKSRLGLYAKDGVYYGTPYHVGAAVMYYNKEILDKAGINAEDIVTWDDFVAAGKKLKSKTGLPMMTVETSDDWTIHPIVTSRKSGFLDENLNPIVDNDVNVSTLQFLHDLMYKLEIAVAAPGGMHHAEEYYAFMSQQKAAAVLMPIWYMGRFTEYMPDLKGKMIVRPLPKWGYDSFRSSGMGGTGTVITKQCEHIELAKEFLTFSKLSKEASIEIWNTLGFDPPRWDVWPELKNHPNRFTEYFANDFFAVLADIKDEIQSPNVGELTPVIKSKMLSGVLFDVLVKRTKTAKESLTDLANELKNQ